METTTTEVIQETLEAVAKLLANIGLNNICIIVGNGVDNSHMMYQVDSNSFVDDCIDAVESLIDVVENSKAPTLH